ncbi:interleukin-18-binding protein [Anolis sagrei]|uniref:interleukin-18-binding protein n=1 Tax=Anolis sagrei TaxID=38937 RepID=UPI003522FF95
MPSAPGFLFLAFLWSCTCFHGTDSAAKLPPSVSIPQAYKPLFGQKMNVSCQGYTTYPSSGIIYWLANGTFVHDLYSEEEVLQEDTIEKANGTGLILRRSLIFRSFTTKDWCTTFECIVVDPSGLAQKTLTWETSDPADPKLNREKKPRKWECTCIGKGRMPS